MNLRDSYGSEEVAAFVRERLRGFDTSKLAEFKLYAVRGRHYDKGYCAHPSRRLRRKAFRITAGANPSLPYPATLPVVVGSVTLPSAQEGVWYRPDGSTYPRIVRRWRYVTEDITFADPEELLVLVAGHEAFHFLRRTRQVPGRNGNPAADRFGLEWVRLFREGRRTNEVDAREPEG